MSSFRDAVNKKLAQIEEKYENDYASLLASVRLKIKTIGDDPDRPGLRETPERVIKSWGELFSGYEWKDEQIKEMLKVFDEKPCNQMVVLRNVEFFSTCEHHMLSFAGTAHIGYIPNGNKIVGVSKLARLLEVRSRRLQIQERICEEIVHDLEYIQPLGSACILVAKHLCVSCRGVGKQHAEMVTSARSGCFADAGSPSWPEFQNMIKV